MTTDESNIFTIVSGGLHVRVLATNESSASLGYKKIIHVSFFNTDNFQLENAEIIMDKIVEAVLSAGECAVWADSKKNGTADWRSENSERALSMCSLMVLIIPKNVFESNCNADLIETSTIRKRTDFSGELIPIFPIFLCGETEEYSLESRQRLTKAIGTNIPGVIFNGTSESVSELISSLKHVIEELPDIGINGKINSIKNLLSRKNYIQAKSINDELYRLIPERYEPYWFSCRIITEDFSRIREKEFQNVPAPEYTTFHNASECYKKAVQLARSMFPDEFRQQWGKYETKFNTYCSAYEQLQQCIKDKNSAHDCIKIAQARDSEQSYGGFAEYLRFLTLPITSIVYYFVLLYSILNLFNLPENTNAILTTLLTPLSFLCKPQFAIIRVIMYIYCFIYAYIIIWKSTDTDYRGIIELFMSILIYGITFPVTILISIIKGIVKLCTFWKRRKIHIESTTTIKKHSLRIDDLNKQEKAFKCYLLDKTFE